MNKRLEIFKYVASDFLLSALAWFLFFAFRKYYIEYPLFEINIDDFLKNHRFWKGTILIPTCWIGLYGIQGLYSNVFKKSRLRELGLIFLGSLLGCVVIFFALVLDDVNYGYTSYYKSILFLFTIQFSLTGISHFLITSRTAKKIHRGEMGFPTLIIGSNEKAEKLYTELTKAKKSAGYKIQGFVNVLSKKDGYILSRHTQHLGSVSQLKEIIEKYQIEEVIIAVESNEHEKIQQIIYQLQEFDVAVKIIPDMYNILTGQVKMNSIMHAALIEISFGTMPSWEKFTKRSIDIIISSLVLLLGFPFYFIVAILVKFSSKGPIFFYQERIGKKGKPFNIIKFRSMVVDAEKNGPALSKDKDKRITTIGRFLRKTRLDETPQFFNVLKGEMSLVGPRPERQFFIDQIVELAPQYKYLHRVKPGITSWGQVKYGYAQNVDEMIERLKFDLIYMENMSLLIDFKIMIHTILVVFQGRGK